MQELLGLLGFIGFVWLIGTFYWLRILVLATILVVWGAATVALPIYFAGTAAADGRVLQAVLTLAVSVIPAGLFLITAHGARRWLAGRLQRGTFWQPLGSRD